MTSPDIRTRLAGLAKWESILAITTIVVFVWAAADHGQLHDSVQPVPSRRRNG